MSVTGTFGQHNSLGVYLSLALGPAIGLGLEAKRHDRRLWATASLLIWVGLLLTFSRGAWMGVGVAMGIGLILARDTLWDWVKAHQSFSVLTLTLLIALCWRSPGHITTLSARPYYWKAGIRVLRKHPVIGIGPGNYESQIRSYLSGPELVLFDFEMVQKGHIDFWQNLHNLYLQLGVEYGLIGLALWLFAMSLGIWRRGADSAGDEGSPLKTCLWLSAIAFLVHNTLDIATVNSFDLLFGTWLALSRSHRLSDPS